MTLEKGFRDHDTVMGKFQAPNADYQMLVYDYVLRPSADEDSGAITITLPPVDRAAGKFYSIVARDADGTNTITIQDKDDQSECWEGDVTLNGPCDEVLFYSDGLKWWRVGSVLTYSGTSTPPTTVAPTTA